jgi:HEAT repeat protein
MKRTYAIIPFLLLLLAVMPAAQSQENTVVTTIVGDVLEQMPADNQADYDRYMAELASTGEEGILILLKMIHAPGLGDNSRVDYALSGLSHYVMGKSDETLRLATAEAYAKALHQTDEREAKAFIITQLQTVGADESVDALAGYLSDESLSDPAARALASIRTTKAGQALIASLLQNTGTSKTRQDAILAIGEARIEGAENPLREMIAGSDENLRTTILYALSRTGSKASIKELSAAAEKAGFAPGKTGAFDACITLLKRVADHGDTKEAAKAASSLLKKATKAEKPYARAAALQILLSIEKEKGLKRLKSAMKDPSREYRTAALNCASGFASPQVYTELVKTMLKAKQEAKADILNWLGRESRTPEKNALLRTLDVRFDLPARQAVLDQIGSKDFAVRQAAAWVLVSLGDASSIPALANLLTLSEADIELGRDALMAFKGDVTAYVVRAIPGAPDAGKIAAIEVLALRKASERINTALDLIKSGSPEVRKAAYAALKDMSGEKDFTLLCGMLETADTAAIAPLQQAVIAAVSSLPAAEQVSLISRRVLHAGESAKHLYDTILMQIDKTGNPIENIPEE